MVPPSCNHRQIGSDADLIELSERHSVFIGVDETQQHAQTIFGGKVFNASQNIVAVQQVVT